MPTREKGRDGGSDPTAPAVRLRGVTKRFGWTPALRGIDLRVDRGERLAVTGPNGAGKTTLLKLLATLLRPSGGDLEVLGLPSREGEAIRRRTALLAPADYLYDELTARENLRFAARMSGVDGGTGGRQKAEALLARVGLAGHAETRVGAFSSGMRKRLAIARLLLRPVELLLLDEPYAGLDAGGVELVDEILEAMRSRRVTVILASHRWGRSLEEAERLVVLEAGRIAWSGPPGERPAPPPAGGGNAGRSPG